MNFLSQRISKILIHLLFWMLFVFVSLFVFSDYYWEENPFLQYLAILIAIVYVNNTILLPFFIKRRYYFLYAIIISAIAFLGTQLYCNVFAECGCSIMKCLSDYLWQTLVPIVFFSFIWMLYGYLQKQEELERIKKENTEMELQYLKSQINPHVLFNNLNTIYSYSLEKPKEVSDMILMLSDNLKHVLYESNSHKVALEKELDYIANYISFQEIRTENIKQIDYSVQTDGQPYKIAPLLLITLIENAFKHSAAQSTIKIVISVTNSILECRCENKIKTVENTPNGAPIGLENLEKRLALLYKEKYELTIAKTDVYSVLLKMNLS
ncbi:sensor histidine kinase [Spongiimicrobium salis]|uniref:sensor histidine kinase n=1 Tax=Spongiimicrobium salis TaxID=1667022 RepID=UPI00374D07F3